MFKIVLVAISLIWSVKGHSLDLDEKLTLRILKLSDTKKTMLINRGSEDGLVAGDHAKFFTTEGVIARGLVEKVSPSRSIWSIYRMVNPEQLIEDTVINLKIATPLKVSTDASKSLESSPSSEVPMNEKMSLNTKSKANSQPNEESDELLEDVQVRPSTTKLNRTNSMQKSGGDYLRNNDSSMQRVRPLSFDLYSMIDFKTTSTSNVTTTEIQTLTFLEKRFVHQFGILNRVALAGFLGFDTIKTSESESLIVVGVAPRFFLNKAPMTVGELSYSVQAKIGFGSASSSTTVENSSTSVFNFGAGFMLESYMTSRLSFKASLIYDTLSAKTTVENVTATSSISGFNLNFGIGYLIF